jgi:hypothetical protein
MTLEIKGIGRMFPMGRHMFQIPSQGGSGGSWVRFVVEDGKPVMLFEAERYMQEAKFRLPRGDVRVSLVRPHAGRHARHGAQGDLGFVAGD